MLLTHGNAVISGSLGRHLWVTGKYTYFYKLKHTVFILVL